MNQMLSDSRRRQLKRSFVTRRVPSELVARLLTAEAPLNAGDLVIAEVLEIGQHKRIEQPDGRRAALYPGDEILIACGARYAPDQFEAMAPTALGPASLVAAGGIAGVVEHAHERMAPATAVRIIGRAARADGTPLNLADFALCQTIGGAHLPAVAVVGTSMNSGKTHSVTALVRGFRAAGLRVAALKATGTGAGGDLWRQLDAGADQALDFTDVGFATTYKVDTAALERGLDRLLSAAATARADVAVVELADGVRQAETAALLASPPLRRRLSGLVFAAADAMGAERGVEELRRRGHRVDAVSGVLTRSPLMIREAEQWITPPVLTADILSCPEHVRRLFPSVFEGEPRSHRSLETSSQPAREAAYVA